MKRFILILCLFPCIPLLAQDAKKVELIIPPGEFWWAGISSPGHQTPYDQTTVFSMDMLGDNRGNQAQPLLLSGKGRYVWSEDPTMFDYGVWESSPRSSPILKTFITQRAMAASPLFMGGTLTSSPNSVSECIGANGGTSYKTPNSEIKNR